MNHPSVVCIISGGMNSATLLYQYLQNGFDVKAISFDYGQRHGKELVYAGLLTRHIGVEHKIITIPINHLLNGFSPSNRNVGVSGGYYNDVPNRNMVMLAIAGAWAVSLKADYLAYGTHKGALSVYPDCKPSFVVSMANAFAHCDWHPLKLEAPFLSLDKGDIALIGKRLGVPYQITWSCYLGSDRPCGKCGACAERTEAFKKAGMMDPLLSDTAMSSM